MSQPARHTVALTDDLALARVERDARLALLVAQAAAGNAAAFEAFYDATIGYSRALARRMLRAGDIDDLLADAYFEVWRNAARFDATRGSAVTWLLTIVRSRALDLLRRQAAQHFVSDGDTTDGLADEHADPAERLWLRQAGTQLDEALRTLNAAERWVLGLAYFRDLSHGAIAQTTGMPLGTVKSLVNRARAKLRDRIAPPPDHRQDSP